MFTFKFYFCLTYSNERKVGQLICTEGGFPRNLSKPHHNPNKISVSLYQDACSTP